MLSLGGGGGAVGQGAGFGLKPINNNNYTLNIIIITHLYCTGYKTATLN